MRRNVFWVLFALDVILLVFLAIAFQFTTPGTAAHAISQVSAAIILMTLIGLAVAIRRGVQLQLP